jgi:hypothetical protein
MARTGHETKIFKNSTRAPSKRSALERIVDKIIILMFSLLFAMCTTGCVFFAHWTTTHMGSAWYLRPDEVDIQYKQDSPVAVAITNFITVFILYGKAAGCLLACMGLPGVLYAFCGGGCCSSSIRNSTSSMQHACDWDWDGCM